ncbi:MAG: hypothetical protein HN368_06085, partial [Spirochaetales bacterium]|nr:hypothetical protein [Spirochaetales bacterium]
MKNYIDIPINETPFSRYGAYIALGHSPGENKLTVHNAKRRFGQDEAFELCFMRNGKPVDIKIEPIPYVMNIVSDEGNARIFIRDDYSLVIDSTGLDISLKLLSKHGYGHYDGKKDCKIIDKVNRCYASINIQEGTAALDGPLVKNLDMKKTVNTRKDFTLECDQGTALMALELSQ